MWQVFVDDRDFRRYEIGYFIYGLGWMICTALLPFLVVDHLNLNYEQIARSTHTILEFTLILMMVPAGHWVDRFGPIRVAGLAFLALTLYPVGLMLAVGPNSLMFVTICYGIGLSGVHLAWTIGPITLAKHPSHAPHYLAIHATMVGFRALIGQYSAVALYTATGIIEIPLVLASYCFFIGAIVMFKLYRDHGTWESSETPPAIDSDAQQKHIPPDVPADHIKD
jgi:MFS family permease